MCMLFGFSGDKVYELNKTVSKFFNFSNQNPDGWGIAIYKPGNTEPVLIKEPVSASFSKTAKSLIDFGVSGNIVISHIRYATIGKRNYYNTHPFVKKIQGQDWTFAHNGTIKAPILKGLKEGIIGDTDSEKVFCYIAKALDKLAVEDSIQKKIDCIENSILQLSPYGKLNFLLSDGSHLFVHTNRENTLFKYESDGKTCFATKVIQKSKWKNVELNKLLVYKDGKKLYDGKKLECKDLSIRKIV